MKKFAVALFFMLVLAVNGNAFAAKQAPITEASHITISNNGKIIETKDVPVLQSGRTLLPLRSLLNSFGIPNDEKNIYWNAKDRSITINSGSYNIFLTIDNKTAYVNKNPITIDVAPVIYKNRTYVPVRFVAQSLNKKVNWDGNLNHVMIVDAGAYDTVKNMLDQSDELFKNLKSLKYSISVDSKISNTINNETFSTGLTTESMVNYVKKNAYTNITQTTSESYDKQVEQTYVFDGVKYTNTDGNVNWPKEAYNMDNFTDDYTPVVNEDDSLCYGLINSGDTDSGMYKFQGTAYMKGLSDSFIKSMNESNAGAQSILKSAETTLLIDQKTNLVSKIDTKLTIDHVYSGLHFPMELNISLKFYDADTDFILTPPVSANQNQI